MFKRKRYFTCHMDSALFQPISKLAYCPHPEEFHEGPLYYLKAGAVFDQRTLPPVPPLTLGDRVVWINDTGVEKAVVKWIGILPDATEPLEWMVGVEFVSVNSGVDPERWADSIIVFQFIHFFGGDINHLHITLNEQGPGT